MSAFLYGVGLQWRLDIRSKSLLITCYVVPLLFFVVIGGVFTSIIPDAEKTLVQSMTVMGITMGALMGVPPSLAEIYAGDMKKVYRANGVPLYLGLVSIFLSAFLHLLIMSGIIAIAAPLLFHAAPPENPPLYFAALAVFIAASLGLGSVLGLVMKNQAKLTMVSMIFFLPSIMLSGIMFSAALLPGALEAAGLLFPAAWGFRLMVDGGFVLGNFWPLAVMLLAAAGLCGLALHRLKAE